MIRCSIRRLSFLLVGGLVFITTFCFVRNPSVTAMKNSDTSFAVVMYHHISEDTKKINDYVITPTRLRSDFEYLKEHGYHTLTVRELYAIQKGERSLPKKSILLTFDDGQESFYTYAYPLLKEFGFSAVFSVIGCYAEQFSTHPDHTISYSHSTWEQLKEMAGSGVVEFGNHSYQMHTSTALRKGVAPAKGETKEQYKSILKADITSFENKFQEKVGFKPNIYTYPFGRYTDWTEEVIKQEGYTAAFTCYEARVVPNSSDNWLFRLGRYNRSGKETTAHFFRRLSVY